MTDIREIPIGQPDAGCKHGTAWDVHCCNCHSGFIFDKNHECPPLKCQREGCEEANPIACVIPGGIGHADINEWLCGDHAVEAGHCCACGMFIAGSDDVFDSGRSGCCETCRADFYEDDFEIGEE